MNKPRSPRRRDFIAGTALVFASVSAFSGAAPDALRAPLRKLAGRQVLVLYRANDTESRLFAEALAAAGCATLALSDDPVRQWRDGLGRLLDEGFLLLGLGNWTDYSILRGLAAEQRRFPLLEMQHRRQQASADWAGQTAQDLLAISAANTEELRLALQALAQKGQWQSAAPSLFSWVIG
jgi:hypothetical protein